MFLTQLELVIVSVSRVLGLELKPKRELPRERRVLTAPKGWGSVARLRGGAGRTFVLQISSVRASHSKRWLLQAGQGGEGERVNKGGLSVGLRPYFVKAAFTPFPRDGSNPSLPQATVQEMGRSGP